MFILTNPILNDPKLEWILRERETFKLNLCFAEAESSTASLRFNGATIFMTGNKKWHC